MIIVNVLLDALMIELRHVQHSQIHPKVDECYQPGEVRKVREVVCNFDEILRFAQLL